MRKALVDQTDWGCDLHGRDLARRGLNGGPVAPRVSEGWRACAGRHLSDSELSAAFRHGGGDDGRCQQQKAGGAVSAWSCGWAEYRRSVRGKELLRDAAKHCDPAEGCAGPGRALRSASGTGAVQAVVCSRSTGDCACDRVDGCDALALRRAGLHGERNTGGEVDRGRLAEPCAADRSCPGWAEWQDVGLPCRGFRDAGAADAAGQTAGDCGVEPGRLLGGRQGRADFGDLERIPGDVRPELGRCAAWHGPGDV